MNLLIVSTNRNRLPMPVMPVGACLVAEAAERAGHGVRLLDLMFERDPLRALRRAVEEVQPGVVGLSVRNIDNNDLRAPVFFLEGLRPLIAGIRAATPAPIVLGGASAGVMPEDLLRYTGAEWAVPGEGEAVFPALLACLSRCESPRDVAGIAWLEDGEFLRTPAPPVSACRCRPPDFGRWIDTKAYLSRLSTVPVQTKLGCRFSCVYCTYRKIEGGTYRLSDPKGVAAAVTELSSRGLRDIEFVDNVFNSPPDHARAICDELAAVRHGASLQSLELNPLFIDDALFESLERAGFSGVGITVESASDRVLEGLGKGFGADQVHRAAEVVGRHRIPCVWIFLLGGPNETRETVAETLRFAATRLRPEDAAFFGSGLRIYPGTELESIARREGVLTAPPGEMLEPVFYTSPLVEAGWIQARLKAAMDAHLNYLNGDALGYRFLPAVHRFGHALGLRPPLWRHTAFIRRSLKRIGMGV
jgi:radical SAM superfamily enzyme YgiQ (UPF0313 family)